MKFIAFGDVHINQNMPFSNKTNDRLKLELEPALMQVIMYAEDKNIKTIVITGDFFDSVKVTPQEFSVLSAFLNGAKRLGIRIYYVNGQHEMDEEGKSILSQMARIHSSICRHHSSMFTTRNDATFFFADYCHTILDFKKRIKTLVENYAPIENNPRILIAHQAVKGRWFKTTKSADGVPPEWFKPSGIIGKNFDLCLFGDFHLKQGLPFAKGIYTGNLTQNDFKDEGNPTQFHVINTKDLSIRSVDVNAPMFHTVRVSKDVPPSFANIKKGAYIRILLTGTAKFVKEYNIDKLVRVLTKQFSPKRISILQPIITDKRVVSVGHTRLKDESDEELVQRIVKGHMHETVPDKTLYEMGVYYLKEARKS